MNQVAYKLLLLFLLSLASSHLQAHSRGESYSKWLVNDQGVQLTYTLSLKDIALLSEAFQGREPDWEKRVSQHIQQNTHLSDNDFPCTIKEDFQSQQANAYLQIEGNYYCHSSERLKIKIDSIFDIDSRHMHIARVTFPNGEISEKVFLDRDREWPLYSNDNTHSQGSTFLTYLILGIEHIATGWDHLAFLASICLLFLLMQASFKTLILVISGFTLGHSASLILTVLGYLNPHALVVESLIAFSISLLAIECIAYKNKQYWAFSLLIFMAVIMYTLGSLLWFESAITFTALLGLSIFVFCYFNLSPRYTSTSPQLLLTLLFGLVHGFGFAGSIQEIGLPQDRLVIALLSFNIGVEIGQLIIVGFALALLSQLYRYFPKIKHDLMIESTAASLCGLGMFWFIERSIL